MEAKKISAKQYTRDLALKPVIEKAIEVYASKPDIRHQDAAAMLKVSENTLYKLRRDPNFWEQVYNYYMVTFEGDVVGILRAMVREGLAGNVQAGRLVLEHSGKLQKNINITIQSPFEKWMDKAKGGAEIEDAEVEEIIDSIPIIDTPLPERNTESQYVRAKKEKKKVKDAIMDEKKKSKYLNQRREWYKWKKRAEAVGIEPLAANRPTKGQRVTWQQEIIRRENEKENS